MYKYNNQFRPQKNFSSLYLRGIFPIGAESNEEANSTKEVIFYNNEIVYETGYRTFCTHIEGDLAYLSDYSIEKTIELDLSNLNENVILNRPSYCIGLPSKTFFWYYKSEGVHIIQNYNEIKWRLPSKTFDLSSSIMVGDFFIHRGPGWGRESNDVFVRNLNTGDIIWQTNIEDFPELYPTPKSEDEDLIRHSPKEKVWTSKFSVYNNIIFLSTNWGRCFAFDIPTGNLLWQLENYIGGKTTQYKDRLIKFLEYKFEITQVNIVTGEIISVHNIKQEFKKLSGGKFITGNSGYAAFEEMLYIVDDYGTILIVNLETGKIEQYLLFETLKKNGGKRQGPVLQGNYMYILDNKNKLHVFKKEE